MITKKDAISNRPTEKLMLVIIVVIAALLRFWNLGGNPPSLYWDEASLGYNAYSILKTGHDEHTEIFPITRFIAFGDYKPPGYIYATVPFVALFGLNELSIRFPSALAGTLTVLVTYFLVKEIFPKSLELVFGSWKLTLSGIASFLLAISPWHMQFSRGAFEANLATFFSVTGIYLFLKGINKGVFLIISFIFFILSIYTFNTHRVFVPIFLFILVMLYYKRLIIQKKWFIISVLTGLILITPLIPFLKSREGQLRFQEVTIFRDLEPIRRANTRIEREGNTLLARLIHNRRVQYAMEFAKHYFDHFDLGYLFFYGDVNPRLGTRDNGILYPIELPLILIGIYHLARKHRLQAAVLILWMTIGLIPAATARETPHALRTLNILPVPQIIAAVGIIYTGKFFTRKTAFLSFLIISFSFYVISYLHTYHLHYPKHWAQSWQYGYKQLVYKIAQMQNNYDKIFITNKYGRPYIYFLLYQQYPPSKFWETRDAERDWFGFWTVSGFDKYRFGDFPPLSQKSKDKWLLVAGPQGLPSESSLIDIIYFPNGEVAFEIGAI